MEDLETADKGPGQKCKTILYRKKMLKEAGLDWAKVGEQTSDRAKWKETVGERMKYLDVYDQFQRNQWTGDA